MKKFFKEFIKSFIKAITFHPKIKAKLRSLISSSKFLDAEFRYKLRGMLEACWDEEILEAKMKSGMKFFYPSKSIVGLRAAEFGFWQNDVFSILFDVFLTKAKTIIEVGANIGTDTMFMAGKVKKNCKIVVFEPCEKYRLILKRNINENNLKNVSVYNYFLSSKTGSKVKLFITSSSASGANSSLPSFPVIDTQTCYSITLDEFFQKNPSLKSLDFLKIDTDGWDQHVVEGGVNIIKKFQPLLFVEFADYLLQKADNSNVSFAKLLERLGYDDFFLLKEGRGFPIWIKGYKKLLDLLVPASCYSVFVIPKSKNRFFLRLNDLEIK